MNMKTHIIFLLQLGVCFCASSDDIYSRQEQNPWFQDGVNLIKDNMKRKDIIKKAKGVILFIGDGMGVSTVTAGRILDGQLKGKSGEENVLSWEEQDDFPNVALSKTYNTNMQTPDSAGTATAYLCGVKTVKGVVGVNENTTRRNCSSSKNNEVLSIIMMAEEAGLSTGIVTTTRITHATPSAAYAHSPNRDWEADVNLPENTTCKDIASQLIDFPYGDGPEVVFGGGRQNFLPVTVKDPQDVNKYGKRKDGRNLVEEWQNKSSTHQYVWNHEGLKNVDLDKTSHLLGLFACSHMNYDYERQHFANVPKGPSLTDMVEVAMKKLQQNEKGYVLLVESGLIDLAHHANRAMLSLHDVVQMNKAVEKVVEMTNPNETLLMVTADHSHVFTIGGYQKRGNPIFGLTNVDQFVAKDSKRYTTLGYYNGPGAKVNEIRDNPNAEEIAKEVYTQFQALIPVDDESHGAEDVGIYARGTQAHLLRGVVEQNYIFHLMDYALCLSKSKQDICRKEGLIPKTTPSSARRLSVVPSLTLLTLFFWALYNLARH